MIDQDKEIWIFDVCDTLYRSNTTFDFLTYLFNRTDPKKLKLLMAIQNKRSVRFLWRALMFKFGGVDLFRKQAINLLKGYVEKDLFEIAADFYNENLIELKVEETFELLMPRKNLSILVSNSIDPIIRVIASNLDIPYFATQLEVKNGILTGHIVDELIGQKHRKMEKENIKSYNVVTDNRTDYKLVEKAREKYVVISDKKEMEFWRDLDPNFVLI